MKQLTNEQLLEHCLQEVARIGDIEAVLRRYPQYASQLRPLLEMAMTVGCYYATVPEPPSGLATGRARLLATAAQQRARGAGNHNSKRKETTQDETLLSDQTCQCNPGRCDRHGGCRWRSRLGSQRQPPW